jgi:succinylglutamate desuccinylase
MLIILGNPRATQLQSRFVSINLNRLFNGAYKEYETSEENRYEMERAKELEGFVQQFFERYSTLKKYHFDCHTAIKPSFHKTFAIRPYQKSSINKQSLALLQAFGIEAVLQHNKPSTTFSAYSVDQFAAEAYTLELGKVKPFGHNDLSEFAAAINTLEKLTTGIQPEVAQIRVTEYKVVAEIIKNSESFELLVDENAPNFTAYPQGTLIARDDNYEYRVAHQSEAVVFPNTKVPVGQRVAVMVTPLNVD